MKLALFIETEMEQLIEDWEEAALQVTPELKDEDSHALRVHARAMLEFITEDLSHPQIKRESTAEAPHEAKAPASIAAGNYSTARFQQGLSIRQVIQELRTLQERVTKAWASEQQGLTSKNIDELMRLNEAIDHLIANSASNHTVRKEQETRLFEAMLKVSPDPFAIFDPDGKLLFLNNAMANLTSVPPREAIGKRPLEFELGLDFATDLYDTIAATVSTGQFQRREFHCRLLSGDEMCFDCELVPVFDAQNKVEAVVTTSRDITDRKLAEYQFWRIANFDALTGIPNRLLFLDRLEQSLLEAKRKGTSFALLFIDLDRFKQANDQLGHGAGDRLLGQVAERISNNVRAMDTVARLGGDEFTVILKDTSRKGAKKAAKALLTSLEQTIEIDSRQVHISGSIGLTLFPDDGKDTEQLMRNADHAMYAAKKHGGHRVQLYRSWMEQNESEHMRLSRELGQALEENQLEVYYEPIIDIRTGAISRAEALLRWNHPDKGLLASDTFLSVAEQSGIADSINAYVLEQAVTCSLRWRNQKGEAFSININESPASFFTRTLVDQWRVRMIESDLDESRITIELTSASMANIRAFGFNPDTSFGLAGLRLHFAIDGFGIEPFSLSALQEFQVESIKVDKELVEYVGQGGDADRILKAIIAMAHAIDIQVVAEGVERNEQLQFLSRAGCDYAQGFLFSTPLCQDDFEALLKRGCQ